MTNPSPAYRNRETLTNKEVDAMLTKADRTIKNEYRRLRAKALVCIAKKFGKRRSEIARLEKNGLVVTSDKFLEVTFTIAKKRKKGFFQYLKECKKQINSGKLPLNYLDNRTYSQLIIEWKEWTQTKFGFNIKEVKRSKKISLSDKYAQPIIDYLVYVNEKFPESKYLFPSNQYSFGNLITVNPEEHLTPGQLLRIVKPLDKTVWLHLFREAVGAGISRDLGLNLLAVAEVKNTLDLEREDTALNYVRRYAVQSLPIEH
jgi:integrase